MLLMACACLGATRHAGNGGDAARAFVDLADWARTNSLQMTRDSKGRDLMLTNRSWRIAFTLNSRQAQINDIMTWLSFPVVTRGTNVSIALLDLRTLLHPLLSPPRNEKSKNVNMVAIDPGHGGRDNGYETARWQEKHHTLLLARRLRTLLQEAGLKVVLTRSNDTYVDLAERVAIARRQHADIFVSLHYNSAGNGRAKAKGVECYCLTPAGAVSTNVRPDETGSTKTCRGNAQNSKNALLAHLIQKATVTSLDVEDRGVRRARFAVLRDATMPAVLVEGGFMSAPDEGRQLVGAERRRDLAQAITDGILDYKRLVERR